MGENFNIRDFLDTSKMTEKEIDYCEFWCIANAKVRKSGEHNFQKEKIQVNYDWDLNYLEAKLNTYQEDMDGL